MTQQTLFDEIKMKPARSGRNKKSFFSAWFSGFVDGEGHFLAEEHNKHAFRCRLIINLRDDDTESLIKIKEHFGGRIHPNSFRSSFFTVSDIEGCLKLVNHFDKYPLQSKKRYDYLIWKKILLMIRRGEHMKGKREEVLSLVRMLREVREYRVGREKVFEKLLMKSG